LAPPSLGARRRTPKISEAVARGLADEIITSGLAAGTRLPPEKEMTETFGVGRTTLREALRLLESRGVLTIRAGPRGGPVVRHPSPSDLSEALTLILQFESATANDLMNARVSLEPAVARAAAKAMTADQLAELRAANADLLEAVSDQDAFLEANARFHETLAHGCGNSVLELFASSLLSLADGRSIGPNYAAKLRPTVHAAHEKIIAAVAARDPDAAEAAMAEHLEDAQKHWRRAHPELLNRLVRWAT
jgi:DNA-binding FadR family transcriptional regulator